MNMGRLRILKLMLILAAVFLSGSLIFSVGPVLEAKWFPVFRADLISEIDGARLKFSITGVKVRSCLRNDWSAFWSVSDVLMPTVLMNEKGEQVYLPIVPSGRHFSVGPYYVPFGQIIKLNAVNTKFILALTYRCHPLWPLEQSIMIPFPADVVARQ